MDLNPLTLTLSPLGRGDWLSFPRTFIEESRFPGESRDPGNGSAGGTWGMGPGFRRGSGLGEATRAVSVSGALRASRLEARA